MGFFYPNSFDVSLKPCPETFPVLKWTLPLLGLGKARVLHSVPNPSGDLVFDLVSGAGQEPPNGAII